MITKYLIILKSIFTGMLFSDQTAKLLSEIIALTTIIAVSYAICWLCSYLSNKLFGILAKKTKTQADDIFVENRVFNKFFLLIPAYAIRNFAPDALPDYPTAFKIIIILTKIYEIIIYARIATSLMKTLYDIYNTKDISRTKSMKGLLQVAEYITYAIAVLFIITTLTGKDLSSIIIGLGTLSAVLMLVFKDSILGFVGGIQLSVNDMVRLGDWITVPQHNADGDVIDISLTTVKVQNFDKTITMIPTYSLVSESFTNWRGMAESEGRRISRYIIIDTESIKFCTPEMITRFKEISLVRDYVEAKELEIAEYNKKHGFDTSESPINGRNQTNLGILRAYITEYLKANENLSKNLVIMVRQLQPTEFGLPLQVYAFCSNKNWPDYERIQSDIFDHIIAAVPMFDLRIYQRP